MMDVALHLTNDKDYVIQLSNEKHNESYSYRVLKIRTENYQKQMTLFLTAVQAREIAETILAGLEKTEEADKAEAV